MPPRRKTPALDLSLPTPIRTTNARPRTLTTLRDCGAFMQDVLPPGGLDRAVWRRAAELWLAALEERTDEAIAAVHAQMLRALETERWLNRR